MCRSRAQSSTAVTSAPDWATNARRPGSAAAGAKLAFRPMPGTSRPTQFGPRMRSSQGRAELAYEARHRDGWGADDGKPRRLRQARHFGEHVHPKQLTVSGVDWPYRPRETCADEVGQHRRPDAAGPPGRADDGNRSRCEEVVEVANTHSTLQTVGGRCEPFLTLTASPLRRTPVLMLPWGPGIPEPESTTRRAGAVRCFQQMTSSRHGDHALP